VNIACHVKQSSKTTSFGGTLSWQWRGGMSSVRVVQTAATRILRHRFPGPSEMMGQVFKFVWRLHWKINAVCMSLSPLVSFKSWFVTYLLNFPRILHQFEQKGSNTYYVDQVWIQVSWTPAYFITLLWNVPYQKTVLCLFMKWQWLIRCLL